MNWEEEEGICCCTSSSFQHHFSSFSTSVMSFPVLLFVKCALWGLWWVMLGMLRLSFIFRSLWNRMRFQTRRKRGLTLDLQWITGFCYLFLTVQAQCKWNSSSPICHHLFPTIWAILHSPVISEVFIDHLMWLKKCVGYKTSSSWYVLSRFNSSSSKTSHRWWFQLFRTVTSWSRALCSHHKLKKAGVRIQLVEFKCWKRPNLL